MSKGLLAALSLLAVTTASASARADTDDLTNASVIVGVERVVSLITWESVGTSFMGTSSNTTVTSFGAFASAPGGDGDAFALAPRLAVDGVVAHGLTLGGAAWIFTDLSASSSMNGGSSQDGSKRTVGGVAPRIGYILPLTPSLAFWPRAGVAYSTLSTSVPSSGSGTVTVGGGGTSLNQFSVDLEGNLVYSPFPHVGFDLELFGSIPASGSASVGSGSTSESINTTEAVVALTAGIMGWF